MTKKNNITLTDADFLRIIIHGNTAFELLRAALELDLFEHLEKNGSMNIDDVAAAIGVEYQPARILLLGLSSIQLITKEGNKYTNSKIVQHKLLKSSPGFVGAFIDFQNSIINPSLTDFAESLRRNTNVGLRHISGSGDTLYKRLTFHPELQKIFYANMGDVSHKTFTQLLDVYDFTHIRHAIDIAGGDGTNSIELIRRYPKLEMTVFDQETVVQLAANQIHDTNLRKRIHFQAGDLFTSPLPEGADAILYFHIFEIWSLEHNTELLRKCYDALPKGGVCLVYNFVSNNEGTGPLSSSLISPYFLTLASGEGMVYSTNDMEKTLRDAGFKRVERYDNLGFAHALVVGHK